MISTHGLGQGLAFAMIGMHDLGVEGKELCVIFRAAQVNSASPEPTPDQVRFSALCSSAFPPSP
ncbi:hypothetical protein PAXRUDRAFT_21737 [Paxillus rubicundulus Ve08.2h10]|uniref:Uncharacterized protein n=1 Tax=Paxillus rubicundulus Ve08.2h10 TaxID=930991 RepID=A0A0D0CPB3_9AGAM|nr:hypothetical protein PAXRUDRAFT_21737 [Paxillus rubicundulus Ve08.2h10]